MRTRLGREVATTLTHPFLTPTGWRPLSEVEVGTRVAVPREIPVFGRDRLPDAEVALLRAHARLVNLGRGALVDEPALIEALRSGRLAGAALDVFENEPLPATSPLWDLPEVILTPHTSGLAPRLWERAMEQFEGNLRRFIAGEPLENVVDKRVGY